MRLVIAGIECQLCAPPLKIELQSRYSGGNVGFGKLQIAPLMCELGVLPQFSCSLRALLFPAQGPHQHLAA